MGGGFWGHKRLQENSGGGERGIFHQEDAGVLRFFWGAGGREKSLIKNKDFKEKRKGLSGRKVSLTSMPESQEAKRVDAEAQGGAGKGFLLEHKGLV